MRKKTIRKAILILTDIATINLTFLLVLYLHFEANIPTELLHVYISSAVLLTLVKLLMFRLFGLYDSLWEYASIEELVKVVIAGTGANIVGIVYLTIVGFKVHYSFFIVLTIFEIGIIGGTRFSYRFLRRIRNRKPLTRNEFIKRVLVIGSGATASLIVAEIKNHPDAYGKVIGYIDDDYHKIGENIAGTKVLGSIKDIENIARRKSVDEIIVAMPTIDQEQMKLILKECKRTGAKIRIMPGVREMIDGQVSLSKIRDVEIEDLLGRDPVDLNLNEIDTYISGKCIMITGGGGSIGSELCRQIAKFKPSKLVIVDNYENSAYDIQNELIRTYGTMLNLDVIIGSVRDRENIFAIINEVKPNIIFHAAAHKHVPLMERSPKEVVKNNIIGTLNLAEAANVHKVERFVLISTDKAVNPTNVMGASKRACEMIIQGLNSRSKTNFTAVRFGNVLGSNGSVIPLFKQQISEGGPVTVTHKDIIRYFMTIPEAAQLVIQAGATATGGEIFILDMGEPVRIYDLAVDLISLSGLKPHEDIKIEVTGLRPGEKLFEELLMAEEGLQKTKYKKIFVGGGGVYEYLALKKTFMDIHRNLSKISNEELRAKIKEVVTTYTYKKNN